MGVAPTYWRGRSHDCPGRRRTHSSGLSPWCAVVLVPDLGTCHLRVASGSHTSDRRTGLSGSLSTRAGTRGSACLGNGLATACGAWKSGDAPGNRERCFEQRGNGLGFSGALHAICSRGSAPARDGTGQARAMKDATRILRATRLLYHLDESAPARPPGSAGSSPASEWPRRADHFSPRASTRAPVVPPERASPGVFSAKEKRLC